jgi:hypothetical protein
MVFRNAEDVFSGLMFCVASAGLAQENPLPLPAFADCFSEIYRTKLWGEANGEDYCSGGGSESPFAVPYVQEGPSSNCGTQNSDGD